MQDQKFMFERVLSLRLSSFYLWAHMSNFPRVAVVILSWNGASYLREFLPSVLKSSYPNLEIIVADNDSDDDTGTLLKESFPQVRLIQNGANLGFAAGYNKALKAVEAEYYVLLNQDVEVEAGWIEPLQARHSSQFCRWMRRSAF